jgi:RNA polymerase sigma-70 factor (ECF subfamily)
MMMYAATCVKLYGVVVRILGRRELAEEVLQEVYIRVWQRAAEYDPSIGSPITWLVSIARNRALDEAKRKTMRSLEDCPELPRPSDDPLANHERNEEQRRLLACLTGWSRRRGACSARLLLWYDPRGNSTRHLNRPVGTVKTWLRRSLAQLADRSAND